MRRCRAVGFFLWVGISALLGAGENPDSLSETGKAQATASVPAGKNLLWDAGFDTGFGNGCWTARPKNEGPSFRDMWSDGVLKLKIPVASRLYRLGEGVCTLSAWVRRAPQSTESDPKIGLVLSNNNYPQDGKNANEYSKSFPVPAGEEWHRVGWTFEIKASTRPHYHVELLGTGGSVLVDEVSLVMGAVPEGRPSRISEIEAGFDIPEETRIYVDGEDRVVDLVVANHGSAAARPKVTWGLYDEYEGLVKEGVVEEEVPAGKTIRKRLPLADLPYGGYRLASEVAGQPMLGDALLAILPKINAKAFPYLGADANVEKGCAAFTTRFMTRLGMNTVNAYSCAQNLGRWRRVNPQPDEFHWQDEAVQICKDAGMETILWINGIDQAPDWVAKDCLKRDKSANRRGVLVVDEKRFTEAYCKYIEQVVRHYGDKISGFVYDDECNYIFEKPEAIEQLGRMNAALCETVRKTSAEMGIKLTYGTHGGPPLWLPHFYEKMKPEDLQYICLNSHSRPWQPVECMEVAHKKGLFPEMYRSGGVGQAGPLRKTSLILDRPFGSQSPMGLFVWQALLHAWVSRPYGTENPKDGLLVNYGYYDLRTLQQTAYIGLSGLTGVEFDNSPGLGMQAMAMMKYQLQGKRPARSPSMPLLGAVTDPNVEYSPPRPVLGFPTGTEGLMVYPFRDGKEATIALLPLDAGVLGKSWKITGMDFKKHPALDLFARPLKIQQDGSVTARDLPVYFQVPAGDLPVLLEKLKGMTAALDAQATARHFEVGSYSLDLDPDKKGYFTLSKKNKDGRKVVLLDNFSSKIPLGKPVLEIGESRNGVVAGLVFDRKTPIFLTLDLSAEGCRITLSYANMGAQAVNNTVTLRVGAESGGKFLTAQNEQEVKAGKTRVDFGAFYPVAADKLPKPETLSENGACLNIEDFAVYTMSPASGKGFAPKTGFQWRLQDSENLVVADFSLEPYGGNGSSGRQKVLLGVTVK